VVGAAFAWPAQSRKTKPIMIHRSTLLCLLTACFGFFAASDLAFGQSNPKKPSGSIALSPTHPAAIVHYPGEEMINVGGHKLRTLQGGQGSPTVVIETGLGGNIGGWSKILPAVNKFTSTFAYSRAGTPPSESAPGPRTPRVIAKELHTLLKNAGVKPPYVLAGWSLGGLYVRVFTLKYPSEVAGLVLVDGSSEHDITLRDTFGPKNMTPAVRAATPPAQLAELDGFAATLDAGALEVPGNLPDLPMVVITSLKTSAQGGPEADPHIKLWRQLQSDIFQSTTYGMHIVTDRSSHNIIWDEPNLVINAIRFVVDTARAPIPPEPPKLIEIKLDDAQSDSVLGDYTAAPGMKITVSRDAGRLYVLLPGAPKLEIGAESETKFFIRRQTDAELTFVKSPNGNVKSVIFQAHEYPKAH